MKESQSKASINSNITPTNERTVAKLHSVVMEALADWTDNFLQVSWNFTGLRDINSRPLLSLFFRSIWLFYLYGCVFILFYWRLTGGDISVGGLVGTGLFICNCFAGIFSIFEVYIKRRKYQRIQRLHSELDDLLQRQLHCRIGEQIKKSEVMLRILVVVLIFFICECLKALMNSLDQVSPVYIYAVPVGFALKARYLQVIVLIMSLNGRIRLLKHSVSHMALENEPRYKFTADIWQPYTQREYDAVNAMRFIYGHIYEIHKTINDCFGWSILCIFLVSFFDFVCNAFWTFDALNGNDEVRRYFYNGSSSVSVALMVSTLFWCADMSWHNSCYIGCLIYKLVKPMGNKRYNDLVSEFSLQALHQQYIITAKHFFQLNLNLLGSMVAAIVTYLVILIQFLLTEQNATKSNSTTIGIATTAGTSTAIMTTLPSMLVLTTELEPVR